MNNSPDTVVIGALVAGLLILAEVIKALASKLLNRRNGGVDSNTVLMKMIKLQEDQNLILKRMADQTNQLYKWHAKTDDDGVPVWYVKKSLEKAIINLGTAIDKLGSVLTQLHTRQAECKETVDCIKMDMQEVLIRSRDEVTGRRVNPLDE